MKKKPRKVMLERNIMAVIRGGKDPRRSCGDSKREQSEKTE